MTPPLKVYGEHEPSTIKQMEALMGYGSVEGAALLSDGHLGYSQPIGGVVAYSEHISPSGVGFDIGCGVKAVRTDMSLDSFLDQCGQARTADRVASSLAFGVGRRAEFRVDHELFDSGAWDVLRDVAGNHEHDRLKANARNQLSTIGGGNHYLCILHETTGNQQVWVTTHFGSRGLGHGIATGFLKLGAGFGFSEKLPKGARAEKEEPTLFEIDSDHGRAYQTLMELAGQYAYAGRDIVVQQVLDIMGAGVTDSIHNHHNYSFTEVHDGKTLQVVRKGATPLFPGQRGAVGGSMCDNSVIIKGADRTDHAGDFFSSVHGAGRVMSRTEAKGKRNRKTGELILGEDGTPKKVGRVSREMMETAVRDYGIELRGGDLDESPFVYRKLDSVLRHHPDTLVEHTLRPVVVCMAPQRVIDPFKD